MDPTVSKESAAPDPEARRELKAFLFLTVVMAPIVAGLTVAGYGFLIWIFQMIAGPPKG